jgi:hypothetical protein
MKLKINLETYYKEGGLLDRLTSSNCKSNQNWGEINKVELGRVSIDNSYGKRIENQLFNVTFENGSSRETHGGLYDVEVSVILAPHYKK